MSINGPAFTLNGSILMVKSTPFFEKDDKKFC